MRGAELTALAERELGCTVSLARLLGTEPLGRVLAQAEEATSPPAPAPPGVDGVLDLLPGQNAMIEAAEVHGSTAYHLLFSAVLSGPVDPARLRTAVSDVVRAHESLRTSFALRPDGSRGRVVHPRWTPTLREQTVRLAAGQDLLGSIHAGLAAASARLLHPYGTPPVHLVLTRTPDGPRVLTLLVHHALVDGWGIGVFWRDLAAAYAGAPVAPSTTAMLAAGADPDRQATAAAERALQLADAPSTVELPSGIRRPAAFAPAAARHVFSLPDEIRSRCDTLAAALGVTRNAFLLAAWGLVVARRCDLDDLLVGVPAAGRPTAGLRDVVALCTRVVPVRLRPHAEVSVTDYLTDAARALAQALDFAEVPFEQLVRELRLGGDIARNPLVQTAFAPHDELVPARLTAGEVEFRIHEGHCGGTPFDAMLYVQRWSPAPVLALEYAATVLAFDEAASLAESFVAALVELTADPAAPLQTVRTIAEAERALLRKWEQGPPLPADLPDLWELFAAQAAATPSASAVSGAGAAYRYRELLDAATGLAARLAEVGVGVGDTVLVAVPRSSEEIVAVLAALRLGAAYVGLDADAPPAQQHAVMAVAEPRAVVGPPAAAALLASAPAHCVLVDAGERGERPPPRPPADPERVAYLAFTSGSTGVPKGVRVPVRGVVRLVHRAGHVRQGPGERYARLAPLAFDASTLEIFAPLVSGAAIEVFPDGPPSPSALAGFLAERAVTVLWLTAGLFRLLAEHRQNAFAGLRQLLTGGDVVASAQVRQVLERHRGLRVSNGYGPTENTTFTTVAHFDDPAEVDDPLPIGRPIAGTRVMVVDRSGHRVPAGAVGELRTSGLGLALGYAGDRAATAIAFGCLPEHPDEVSYATGDIVRWDADGRLRFLGRRDRQVKVFGHRIELHGVEQALRDHPAVRDAYVTVVGDGTSARLLAGVVAVPDTDPSTLREHVARAQPAYAVPSAWALVTELPLTANGKVDVAMLARHTITALAGPPDAYADGPAPHPAHAAETGGGVVPDRQPEPSDVEDVITDIWVDVLEDDDFGPEDGFFEVGGSSVQLMAVRNRLRQTWPGCALSTLDMYRYPSVRTLARHVCALLSAVG
ncbi:amino acid adenylation domain-containing protein [Micromonospora haikouensis]|uniref:Amino acid adenylation domain-containing protein n=2 Tax=Micromonospora haikouensis TaxID=686309 RepID=A0A1C4XDW2_9ACTN|nr:amino acid adenylation domain-containing protein [Micromonospora haikouensis]